MSPVKIYGVTQSRAIRCTWAAIELGIEWEHLPVNFSDGSTGTPEYRAINPVGAIPALVDGDFRLSESLAINLYLAKKHSLGKLYPTGLEDEATLWQWTLWVATWVEKPLLTVLLHRAAYPEEKREPALADNAETELQRPFGLLNAALADRAYLLGDDFTIADLNVASVFSWAIPGRVNLAAFPHLAGWLSRCLDRPSFKAARKG